MLFILIMQRRHIGAFACQIILYRALQRRVSQIMHGMGRHGPVAGVNGTLTCNFG